MSDDDSSQRHIYWYHLESKLHSSQSYARKGMFYMVNNLMEYPFPESAPGI